MEADRMATLGEMMTAGKLDTQRKIVLNERRQSYENRPYGKADLLLDEKLFPEGHPYHWPVIGSARDLEAATLDDVKQFFARWYVPSNASLAIVGDVDAARAQALVEKYFGWMPKAELPERAQPAPVKLEREDRASVEDAVELPRLTVAWPSPKAETQGDADCDLIAQVIGRGRASRLYTRLVHELQIAAEVSASQETLDLQSIFRIDVLARPGHTTQELLTAVDAELAAFLGGGPTVAEIAAARTGLYTSLARAVEGLQARAEVMQRLQRNFGDATAWRRDYGRYEEATPASIQATARSVLGPGRVVLEVQPQKKEAAR
jgi:predicted Zn-dependent peptidase